MVIRETELIRGDLDGERLRSEWAQAEVDQESVAYEKALGICSNLRLFAEGKKDGFRAYFVKGVPEQASIERHLRRALNLSGQLAVSEIPLEVLTIDDVKLYRWSGLINEDEFDIYYEACRGDETPIYFQQSQKAFTEVAEA